MLRKCPRCNEEITNDSLIYCPKCGNFLEYVEPHKTIKVKNLVLFLFIVFCFAACIFSDSDTSNNTTEDKQERIKCSDNYEIINCSDIKDEIFTNQKNNINFERNEELIIKGFENGCDMCPYTDKYSFLFANASHYGFEYAKKGNYTQAILYKKKSIDYANKSTSSFPKGYIPYSLLNIAEYYYKLGQYTNSKTYCLKVLPLTKPPTSSTVALIDAPVLELLADNEYALGDKQNALMHYKKALNSYAIFINRCRETSINGQISQEIMNPYYQTKQKYDNLYNELNSSIDYE